jgi:hypothetical protein
VRGRCEKVGEASLGLYAVVDGRVEIANIVSGGQDYETLMRRDS